MHNDIINLTQRWLDWDANSETHKEIQKLFESENEDELRARLCERLQFGTAGLRGKMEAGFSRMNDLTVLQASQGLAMYVLEHVENARTRGVVIGYDHRYHSEDFALLTANAFLHEGYKVYLFNCIVHTPMVPFAIKKKQAACGVMITASHNPKQDNGYKVYWENACQILPPHDQGIAEAIENNLIPCCWNKDLRPLTIDSTEELHEAYFDEVNNKISISPEANKAANIQFVYTAMHGVGYVPAARSFANAGFKPFRSVPQQTIPDPKFPTVKFPNPEEKGALDLAMRYGKVVGGDIILANDPDADRFCAAEIQSDGSWKIFSGNQIGVLLASRVLAQYKTDETIGKERPMDKLAMFASTVSSRMLRRMAEVEGFHFEETLTGFKWLGNAAINASKNGYDSKFAYEEAIGYMVGDIVRDKDGISALIAFAELAVDTYARGKTLFMYLEELYGKYGNFINNNSYVICKDPNLQTQIFDRIRNPYPTSIGKYKVIWIRDLTRGYDSATVDHKPVLPCSASSQMITFELENGCVGTLRTSGTEPKIKYYVELAGSDEKETTTELAEIVDNLLEEWLEVEKNNLQRP